MEYWNENNIFFNCLVQFGRMRNVVNKDKIKVKMKEQVFPAIMVIYAENTATEMC